MDYISAIVLAVVEGITEFLPISSTGHLILTKSVLGLESEQEFVDAFIVIIQLPAILSVCVYFWKDLWPIENRKLAPDKVALWSKVIVAFLPAVVFGLLLNDVIESLFNDLAVAISLIIGGLIIIAVERRSHPSVIESIQQLSYKQAIAIGLFQCVAMIPGTSRSGATIVGGLLLGATRGVAAEFSFFLAIPTMVGAFVYTILKSGLDFTVQQWIVIAIGSVVAFLVAYAVVAFLMAYIRKHSFTAFGIYRIIIGIVVLWFLLR